MSSSTYTTGPARQPGDLYGVIQDAVNRGDIDAFVDAHDDRAVIVIPPDGQVAHGRAEIAASLSALLTLRPRLTMAPVRALESDGLALTHGRWQLTIVDDGSQVELSGVGTMVSRRSNDGVWRVLLDDPLTGA